MSQRDDEETKQPPAADAAANRPRALRRRQDRKDASKINAATSAKANNDHQIRAMQTSARKQPAQLPAQHFDKPGNEHGMALEPRVLAPDDRSSAKLDGKAALVTGGDWSIGGAVAVQSAREGADVSIVSPNEHCNAEEAGRCVVAEGRRCQLIACDVKVAASCRKAVERSVQAFGAIDVPVTNATFLEHADAIADAPEQRFVETPLTTVYGYLHRGKTVLPKLKRGSCVNGAARWPERTPLNPADEPAGERATSRSRTDLKLAAPPDGLSPDYAFLTSPAWSGYIAGTVLPVSGRVGAI